MINEFILQLTHDNDLFNEQWTNTFEQIEDLSTPNDEKLVLNALVDYVLIEPIDPPPCYTKYLLITKVIEKLLNIEFDELVNAFIRVLDLSRTDQWDLHFLETIYPKLQISEQPLNINLIEKILNSLKKKFFVFNSEKDNDKWRRFLTEDIFSNSLIQQFKQSPIWSQIATILKDDNESILTKIERLILENKYKDAKLLLSDTSIDLEDLLNLIIRLCPIVENRDLFCSTILTNLISKLEDLSIEKKFATIVFDLALSILKLNIPDAPGLSYRLLNKTDFYPWKELNNKLIELIKICITYDQFLDDDHFSPLCTLENILDLLSGKIQISEDNQSIIIDAILRWANTNFNGSSFVYRMGMSLFNLINFEKITEDICVKFIDTLQNRVYSDNEEFNKKTRTFFFDMSKHLRYIIEQLNRLSHPTHIKVSNLFLSLLDHSLYDEEQHMTFAHVTLLNLLFRIATSISNENDARVYEVFLDRMYNDAKDEEKNVLYEWWTGFWRIIGAKLEDFPCNHIQQFLDYTFNSKDMSFIGILLITCIKHPELYFNHFDELVDTILANHGEHLSNLTPLFSIIVQKHPEIVLLKHINQIFSSIETIPFSIFFSMIIQSLGFVANFQPDLFDNSRDKLIKLINEKQNLLVFECFKKYILSSIILHKNEQQVDEYLNLLIDLLKTPNCSNDLQKEIFYTCLLIGLKYKQILINRRDDFIKLQSNLLVNYIDNTTISKIDQSRIRQAEEEIELIEQNINIKQENHLPLWIEQISKLLNQRNQNDWRLLSKQLGFSSNEIKHWSMQIDPSMSLLNEWFITHRKDHAIYSLVKALVDINRRDIEQIIRQNEKFIPENLSIDLKRLPPIFLSFHSSKQTLVTKLNEHLNAAGYTSKLYDEQTEINTLDTYIYGAKVIVCCINASYVQSENCSKQFQLILNMKKPLIVLYTEEQTGPLEGIQFSNDWSENKFIELFGQIRYYVAPDPDIINEKYHHWFVPRLDHLIFLKSNTFISFNDTPLVVFQPQIFISYQWDYQQDILHLYKQLTQLGYRVWLDIFQMGGGDSLLEKSNIAIHQSLCLLTCITPKYIKSINGQHDLSLAKDFNKPIIPLLLEETNSWPLNDLQLTEFAGKSYIDFRISNENADRWTGKQFEMLLAQLKKIIPNVHTDKPRHLLEMQRPISATRNNHEQKPKRISSAPIIPQSRACSLM